MRKEDMTWIAMLAEAVGVVSAVIYLGLQIYLGVTYAVSVGSILLNIVTMLLLYAFFTVLTIYPERVNGLRKEVCVGKVRKYTLRMIRIDKLILTNVLLFTSICDVMGKTLPAWFMAIVIVIMVAVAGYCEYRIFRSL